MLGVLSLIFWSLLLVISVKYVGIILRADNNGEGGVLALTTRVLNERPVRGTAAIAMLGLIGCALFYGDGVITPAVTVLGAIEGLSVATPALAARGAAARRSSRCCGCSRFSAAAPAPSGGCSGR